MVSSNILLRVVFGDDRRIGDRRPKARGRSRGDLASTYVLRLSYVCVPNFGDRDSDIGRAEFYSEVG
jgi:hypothetical protein